MDALLPIRGIHSLPRAPSRRQLPPAWGRAQRLKLFSTETRRRATERDGDHVPPALLGRHAVSVALGGSPPCLPSKSPGTPTRHPCASGDPWVMGPRSRGDDDPPRPSFSAMALRHRPLANSVLENLIAAAAGVACRGTGFALCTMPAAAPAVRALRKTTTRAHAPEALAATADDPRAQILLAAEPHTPERPIAVAASQTDVRRASRGIRRGAPEPYAPVQPRAPNQPAGCPTKNPRQNPMHQKRPDRRSNPLPGPLAPVRWPRAREAGLMASEARRR